MTGDRPHKMTGIIARLDPGERIELERLLYVPGKPNFKAVAKKLGAMGQRISDRAVGDWWKAEGREAYRYVPAEGAMHRLLALSMGQYEDALAVLQADETAALGRVALQEMASRRDAGPDKGVLAVGRHLRELEKSIRTTAERIHNLETRAAHGDLLLTVAQQTLDYLMQALKNEGLEQANLATLETLGASVLERLIAENRLDAANLS